MATRLLEAYPIASNACARCKESKKRCNKALPSCGRCSRLARECKYPSEVGSEVTLVTNGKLMSSTIPQGQVRSNVPPVFETRWQDFSFQVDSSPWLAKLPLQKSLDVNMDQQINACVLDLLAHEEINVSFCCRTYFNLMTPRLPIVSETSFFSKLSHLYSAPDAHYSLLLLSMALVSQRVLKPNEPNVPGTLYYTAKSFFTVLCSTNTGSLELLQSGVLLASYEFCQALLDVSKLTITTCANMGYSLGIDKMLKPHFQTNLSSKAVVETGRCLWWAIFIMERMISVHRPEQQPLFTCQTPQLDDLLPLNITAPKHKVGTMTDGNIQIEAVTMHKSQVPEHWIYAQTAQSAYLLQMVIEALFEDSDDMETRLTASATLEAHLQCYLLSLIEQPRIRGIDACGPYSIIMSALFLLNLHRLNLENSFGYYREKSNVVTTLRSFLRMAVQTIQLGERQIYEYILQFPFWTMHFPYVTGVLLVVCNDTGLSQEETADGLGYVKDMLNELEANWRIGGMYVDEIRRNELQGPRFTWSGPPQVPNIIAAMRSSSSVTS